MADSCAVCAETLEWVAYGACGHKEVCSTCVARLRFICEDRRCCICKTEYSVVFVTKALGDYTNDFSVFPSALREGHIGSYWYHEDTQAIFDDVDHYNMIKAMCRLSCSVCDNVNEQAIDGPKKKHEFRNVEQLKGHLFHQHELLMCSLCLEGRKVSICEQKLYTGTQLKQHINSGDSEVDRKGSERGGFTGHPMCEFCKTPFYADNELLSHMSTEHYTCHICQRQHPGHYDYFRNYDDLEIHFCREHFLCEDEACLAKKFVVFQCEAEMKRHNTMEHGGRMSSARRNAALQIPTSFRYRSGDQGGQHRGRGRTFRRDSPDDELSAVIQASLDASMPRSALHDPPPSTSLSYSPSVAQGEGETTNVDTIIQPVEALTTDPEKLARYLQPVADSVISTVRELQSIYKPSEVLCTEVLIHAAIRNAKEVKGFPVKWNIIISQLESLASCFVSNSVLNGAICEVFRLADKCIRHKYEDTQGELDSLLERLSSQTTGTSELVDAESAKELLKSAEQLLPAAVSLAKKVKEYKKHWNMVISKMENIASALVSNFSNNVLEQLEVIMDAIELAEKSIGKVQMQSDLDLLIRKINLILSECCPKYHNLMVDRMASPDLADKIHILVHMASSVNQCKTGVNASARTIKDGTAEVIVIAADAYPHIILPLRDLAKEHHVGYVFVPSRDALGETCQLGKLEICGRLRKHKKQPGVSACSVVSTEGSVIGKEIGEVKKEIDMMGN